MHILKNFRITGEELRILLKNKIVRVIKAATELSFRTSTHGEIYSYMFFPGIILKIEKHSGVDFSHPFEMTGRFSTSLQS